MVGVLLCFFVFLFVYLFVYFSCGIGVYRYTLHTKQSTDFSVDIDQHHRNTMALPVRQLAGKCALITGSSQGIGYGIIRQLASQGCTVIMHGKVSEEELSQKSAALANEMATTVGFRNADLTQPKEIRSMIASIQQEYGTWSLLSPCTHILTHTYIHTHTYTHMLTHM